jgi:hypothetical protein
LLKPSLAAATGNTRELAAAVPAKSEPPDVVSSVPEETAMTDCVRQRGSINNAECRELLGVGMHQAWYLLRKLHRSDKLKQDSSGRWAQYRLA